MFGRQKAGNGWPLTGLALPQEQDLFIRARGYNGVSVVESLRLFYLRPPVTFTLYLPVMVKAVN
jgi:hypothetical protein